MAQQHSDHPTPPPWASRLTWLAIFLALGAVVVAALSGFGHRWGWWHFSTGFQVLRWGVYIGMGAAGFALIALLFASVRRRADDLARAIVALVMAGAVIIVPMQALSTARSVPPIHDISTDLHDPPPFEAVLPLRDDATNPPEYGGKEVAEQQRAAYPDILPFRMAEPPAEAFDAALAAARDMGWEVVSADQVTGRIEAVDTTFWFGFRDDVVVRIMAVDGGSRIDVRSKSRVGRGDAGANAKRIERFLDRLG